MLYRFLILVVLFHPNFAQSQVHPISYGVKEDFALVKKSILNKGVLQSSYNDIKADIDKLLNTDIDVPFPKDAAGGYSHDRHKANYTIMFNSGVLYQITGNPAYAKLVKDLFLKYATLNPQLKNHPQATSSSPGHIFWQALNDANWMVYTGMAFDLIHDYLTPAERKLIEDGAFKPEVDFFTKDLKDWFNLLHNHGVWACAGVGMIGLATDNKDYIDMALYGTDKNGKSGFLAQMDNLFSPDGYYTEGPYYTRYAILPYMIFANALNHYNPSLKIFERRNSILQKALMTCLQQTNIGGSFFPLNDALKDKDYTTNELVTAIDIAWHVYGQNDGLLTVAKSQGRVILNKGGVSISEALDSRVINPFYPYKTIESTDGVFGDKGGISIFRNGKQKDLTSLLFKYASHGLSHGHFDKLGINLFDKGNEILQDYGSARFIGIEQKYGGRYLPENTAYAAQTIAHNTIVVDEASHFNGIGEEAEKFHSQKLFSDTSNPNVLAVAAKEENAYKGVRLQRNLYMLQLPKENKIIVDIFNVSSESEHQYDLPFQYNGQFISTSFKYSPFINKQETLGSKNGYQFLWKEATASAIDTTLCFTFLKGKSYYSISSLVQDSAQLFFTRCGANDPNFNLRREPSFIIRKKGTNQAFVSVIELHGKYDPIGEFSTNAKTSVKQIKLLKNDGEFSAAEIMIADRKLLIVQCNNNFEVNAKHSLTIEGVQLNWTGPYTVYFNSKKIN